MGKYGKPSDVSSASGDRADWKELRNSLLLFTVTDYKEAIGTKDYGDKPAVLADVAILDGDQAGIELKGILVFPSILIDQLKGFVGEYFLGRLGKAGRAWKLSDPTEADEKLADAFIADQDTAPADDASPEPAPEANDDGYPF